MGFEHPPGHLSSLFFSKIPFFVVFRTLFFVGLLYHGNFTPLVHHSDASSTPFYDPAAFFLFFFLYFFFFFFFVPPKPAQTEARVLSFLF